MNAVNRSAEALRHPKSGGTFPATFRSDWHMAVVAGVDFGTLSVRVSIVDSERGLLASAISEYPLHRKREDPDFATQSHDDHMRALADATRQAVKSARSSRRLWNIATWSRRRCAGSAIPKR